MKDGFELEDVCLVAEVESEVIEQVRDGRITAIGIVSPKSKNEACIPAGLVLVICDKGAEGVLGMMGRRAKSAPQTGKHRGTHLCSKRPKGYDRQRFGDAL